MANAGNYATREGSIATLTTGRVRMTHSSWVVDIALWVILIPLTSSNIVSLFNRSCS